MYVFFDKEYFIKKIDDFNVLGMLIYILIQGVLYFFKVDCKIKLIMFKLSFKIYLFYININ